MCFVYIYPSFSAKQDKVIRFSRCKVIAPIFLLIDVPVNWVQVTSRASRGKPIVSIEVKRRSLVNLYRISMQEDTD